MFQTDIYTCKEVIKNKFGVDHHSVIMILRRHYNVRMTKIKIVKTIQNGRKLFLWLFYVSLYIKWFGCDRGSHESFRSTFFKIS